MRLDSTLQFVPYGSALSIVGATGASFRSNIIDLLGSGVGTAPPVIIGNATVFGADMGVGHGWAIPTLDCYVGTAFATSNSSTLNVQLQAAVDQGSGGNYQPGTWDTLTETGAITAANLAAGTVIARFDWPPNFPANLNPRFLSLNFVTPTGTAFTAGTIGFAGITATRDDYAVKYAANNYKVA